MTVFSRLTAGFVLACIATSSLLSTPVAGSKAVGARHLKHQQPRAHHLGNPLKREPAKRKRCAAKSTSITTTSVSSTTTSAPAATTTKPAEQKPKPQVEDKKDEPKSTSPAPGGGKAGLGWIEGQVDYIRKFTTTGKVTWCYTWSPWPCCSGNDCPESVPMFWGAKQAGDWKPSVYGKPKHILAHNEPDQGGQAAVSVADAVKQWWQYIEPVNGPRKGAPAVTTSPHGFDWIEEFLNSCQGCQIDFVPVHYYGTEVAHFKETITKFHNLVGKPIWVTEWACQDYSGQNKQCSPAKIADFMAQTQAWLDQQPWCERYAYFAPINDWKWAPNFNTQNGLLHGDKPSPLGYQYIEW